MKVKESFLVPGVKQKARELPFGLSGGVLAIGFGQARKRVCMAFLCLFVSGASNAFFLQVTTSTGTPESVGVALLQQTTTQFNALLIQNPLVPNTYSIKLFGLNPNYTPTDLNANLVTQLQTFPYASGMVYERSNDAGLLGAFMSLCGNATNFNLVKIDSTTCQGVLGYVDNFIISQTSGIAVVPSPLVGL